MGCAFIVGTSKEAIFNAGGTLIAGWAPPSPDVSNQVN